MWTPYQIEIMLHHHCSGAPFERRSGAPGYPGTVKGLKDAGLLEDFEGIPRSTPRGQALIEMWCGTPLPEQRWFDPRFATNHTERA